MITKDLKIFEFKFKLYKKNRINKTNIRDRGDFLKVIISEKEIAAKRIAAILSGNGVKEEKVYGIPVHYIKYAGNDCAVIGLKGPYFTG